MYWLDKQENRYLRTILWMKVFIVTWTNSVVGQVDPEDIKCFEDYHTALGFAKLMSKEYDYVNFYEDEVTKWDS